MSLLKGNLFRCTQEGGGGGHGVYAHMGMSADISGTEYYQERCFCVQINSEYDHD